MVGRERRVHVLLAVGSANSRMVSMCDPRHTYVGAFCIHTYLPGAPPASRAKYDKFLLNARVLSAAEDVDKAWDFLSHHPLHSERRLLVPGRFYGFRELTRRALEEKVAAGHAYAFFATSALKDAVDGSCMGVIFTFDNDLQRPDGTYYRHHTAVFAPALEAGAIGAGLNLFGSSRPVKHETGKPLVIGISAGPHLNNAPPPKDQPASNLGRDVEPRMAKALAAANWTRPMGTHLRVYRYCT